MNVSFINGTYLVTVLICRKGFHFRVLEVVKLVFRKHLLFFEISVGLRGAHSDLGLISILVIRPLLWKGKCPNINKWSALPRNHAGIMQIE
jgi:hypothetical protein